MDLFEKCKMEPRVLEMREKGVYPYFHALETRQDTEVVMEGKRRLMLGSNNYLGLTVNEEVIQAGVDALYQYGTGCSGSRFLNGTLRLHLELEEALARFLEKEAAATFSTGFQSNLGIISALVGRGDYVVCDRENHASIYDGCKLSYGKMLRYRHGDMGELRDVLESIPHSAGILIVTDGIFSMSGDLAKLPEIVALAEEFEARVMVDDAHGLGTIGRGGRGTADYFGLANKVDIYMGTFSKSLASLGGYVAGSAAIIDYIRHASRPFIFSASMPPANCATALSALKHLEEHPQIVERLHHVSAYMRDGLRANGVAFRDSIAPIIPIYTYTPEATLATARALYENGVYVNPVLPPATPATECLLRSSYMASFTDAQLDEAIGIFARVWKERQNG